MCDPVSLTIAAVAIAAVGTGVATYSAVEQSNFQGKVANQNAKLADASARDALDRGKVAERDQYRRSAAIRGAQNASMAANGIDTSFGSALDVARDTDMFAAEDAQTVRENAIRESKGFSISAANYRNEAGAAKSRATGQAIGGALSIAGSIAGSAAQFGGGPTPSGGNSGGGSMGFRGPI